METSFETGPPSSGSTSSPQDSPAPITASPVEEPASRANTDRSGLASLTPFAHFVPATSSSRTSPESEQRPAYASTQENLLLEWSAPIWPRSAIGGPTTVCELPTSERLTAETDGSSLPDFLLPTPSAQESTPTDEFLEEFRTHLDPDDPLHRLWLPGRKWMTQRTLSRTVPALAPKTEEDELLPTPGAWLGRRPENSMADPERAASREREGTRGKRSVELPDALAAGGVRLLPTPVGSDARGLQDGDNRDGGPSLREIPRLLPTPTTQDGENTAGPSQRERNSDPLNVVAADMGEGKLLPTPTAGDAKASGSRNLEGSKAHPGVSLTDAIQTGDSTTPRLLPTPTSRDHHAQGATRNAGASQTQLSTLVQKYDLDPERALYPEREEPRLLPTPQAADGDGGRQEKGSMSQSGRRPSGQKATLPLGTAISMREELTERPFTEREPTLLLPTPVANEENPGAGGELRAALTHGEGRRNETGTDTMGRPNRGRSKLLPTPTAADGENASEQRARFYEGQGDNPTLLGAARRTTKTLRHSEDPSSGASTGQPSSDGNESADGQLPLQPTSKDA